MPSRLAGQRIRWAVPLVVLYATLAGCDSGRTPDAAPVVPTQPQRQASELDAIIGDGDDNASSTSSVGPELAFADMTQRSGIQVVYRNGRESKLNSIVESLGGGVAMLDYDRDGQLDLAFAGGGFFRDQQVLGYPTSLYRNLGEFRFEDVSKSSGVGDDAGIYTHGCHPADYDNDGFTDLLITGYGGLRLFRNQGDGSFREVHEEAGLLSTAWASSAGWADFNGDGVLDLYVCHYVNWSFQNNPPCQGPQPGQIEICSPRMFDGLDDVLYYGNGDGTFRDVSQEAGLQKAGKGLGVVIGDLDLDGDQDLYVANDTSPNFLYLNDGSGKFEEKGLLHSVALDGLGTATGSMGVDIGDYNGDLKPDLWVANYEQEAFGLYENLGQAMFLPASAKAGITSLGGLFVGFGTAFLDADRDGDDDLVVANGHVINYPSSGKVLQLPLMLVNQQGRRYLRKQFQPGQYFSTPNSGRGLATGDLDGDGRLDLVFANNESEATHPAAVIRNESTDGNGWLCVRLVGTSGNRDAIGARLILKTSKGQQLKMIKGGASYLSQSDLTVHFGVPQGATLESLTVDWPASAAASSPTTLTELTPNTRLTVVEGQP